MRFSFPYDLLLLFTCFFVYSPAFSQQYGLSFFGHTVLKDQRTGLVLSPDREFSFNNEFELSFDMALHRSHRFIYGYVFRIILNEETNIDLVLGNRTTEDKDFTIIENNSKSEIAFNIDPPPDIENWIHFRIKFLLNEDKIIFYEGDHEYADSSIDLQPHSRVLIMFGACFRENYITTDVPPIMIRDIKLYGRGGKLQNHWPLDQTEGETAIDILNNKRARVTNPNWLRNAHLNWKRLEEINLSGYVQILENSSEEKIYLLGQDFLIVYDAALDRIDTISYSDTPRYLVSDGQAVYNYTARKIVSYNLDNRQLFFIDPLSGEVKQEDLHPYVRKNYLHHNKHFYERDSSLYIFNGYGHYLYKNQIIRCHVFTGYWEEPPLKGNLPAPRYLAASGYLDDTIYFLGGYGSESGKQMLRPQHYHDLYAFSIRDLSFGKIDSFPQPPEEVCFANSLVIDSMTRNYYALAFPEFRYNSHLQLVRGSLNGGPLELLGNQVPYQFNDINSFADLYHFPSLGKLFAVTTLNENSHKTRITIHSIGFPPIANQPPFEGRNSRARNTVLIILICSLVILSAGILIRKLRIRNKKRKSQHSILKNEDIPDYQEFSDTKNAINFFGGFQVIDKTGTDITHKFSPLLKELFLIILLNSIKNEKGISSALITEIIWMEKSERNARNNLSVNITKLKKILEKLDGCQIDHKTGYWKIIQTNEIHNEYCEVEALVNSRNPKSPVRIRRLIEITKKGPFLVNLGFDWMDGFKARISDRITNVLLTYAESLDVKEQAELIIDVADCLFNFDIVNEEIMILKCKAQYAQGKHSLAKNSYQNFCNEYKILYEEDYFRSFSDIIKN